MNYINETPSLLTAGLVAFIVQLFPVMDILLIDGAMFDCPMA